MTPTADQRVPITFDRTSELVAQLCAALSRPFGSTRADATLMVRGYFAAVEDWPAAAVEWAVWRACKTAKRLPKPSELAELCGQSPYHRLPAADSDRSSLQARYDAWMADPWGEVSQERSLPCPVCGSTFEWTPRGLLIVHDGQRHQEARIGYSDAGNPEWRHLGPLPPPVRPSRRAPESGATSRRAGPTEGLLPAPAPPLVEAELVPPPTVPPADGPPADAGDAWEPAAADHNLTRATTLETP